MVVILCNQENFMLRDNSYKLTRAFPNFQLIINPAVKLTHDKGRPRNGMFIAIPQSIRNCITDVSPGFWRIQAIIINLGETATLLINSYFPTDPRRANVDESELLETLGHIKNVIRKHDFDSLLWAGDINADFSRNTSHTSRVSEDLEELGLIRSWDRFVVDFTCCHEMLGTSHVATLDHFFWSDSLSNNVIDAGVLHRPENLSDHSPIYCVLQYPDVPEEVHDQVQQKPKPSWKKSSHEQKDCYRVMLEERISQMIIPPSVTNCRNVQCRIKAHRDDLDIFTMELLETMQGVAEENLPMPASGGATSNKEKKHIPGWTEAVKPFREEAYFWHQVWMSYGRPLNTEIHVMMKKTKNRYHYQYKKCRKAEDKIKRSKLLNFCL